MKRFYAFLVVLLAFGVISSEVAQAQTYSISNYLVRNATGSGSSYQPITGTEITELNGSQYNAAEYFSKPINVPFNIRFMNNQYTTSNQFVVDGCGDVIFDPQFTSSNAVSATYQYVFENYYAYSYCYNTTYGYGYDYPYNFQNNEFYYYYNFGFTEWYAYYPNFILMPFATYDYQYPPGSAGDYSWTVLGSAPSRQLVVQVTNRYGNLYYYGGNAKCSFQTVVYERGVSTFQFNYGPESGSWGSYHAWGEAYNYGSYGYAYNGMTGIKAQGGQYLNVGWYGSTTGGINDNAYAAGTDGTGTNPKFAYNEYGGGAQYYLDANGVKQTQTGNSYWLNNSFKHLPSTSYKIFIAWPYDFSADAIDTPVNETPYTKGTAFTPTVTITNQGTSVPTSLQVNLTISVLNGPQVYNQTVTVSNPAASFTSQLVSFPPYTPHDTVINGKTWLAYNIYEDTAIVYNLQPTADQDPSNNTVTNEWICSPPNDIKAVAILSPPVGTAASDRTPVAVATPIDVRFRNLGTNNQTNVPVTAVVRDPSGAVVYRDTVIIPNWPSGPFGGNSDGTKDYSQSGQGPGKGAYYDTSFANWTPVVVGTHKVCGIAIMANDQLRADDTTCGPVLVRPIYDAAAVAIVNPQPDEEKPAKTTWKPGALFQSTGVSDLFDVPVEVRIYSCTNPNTPVFVADSTMPELNIDQNQVRFYFPSDQGQYHISNLVPGCYTICAIAKYPGDGDHSNDTACSEFSIIPQLSGNIYVGVGQRFQTIHAAVDSLKFRGIGGPLNLILTDANYTENGTYRVSSPYGALDMRGIRGLSASTPVTWEPKPGVTPTITFTGSEPACFYFGDLFGGYMTFEGYNPLGVRVADKVTPEPAKRGITIVDNETSAGAAFDIESGSSNITLKDLVIHGNGNFTNDSSSAVRLWNDQNMQIYLFGVHDTVPINHIVVNNCELGNAKYGLYDHGLHDMFNLGQEQFIVWRNNSNVFTRNTVGTASNPLSYAGIQFNNEQDLTVSHNEVSNVNTANAGPAGVSWNAYGIASPSPADGDTGNVVRVWVDGNKVHNIRSAGALSHGVAIRQAVTIYTIGNGQGLDHSVLPVVTQNRVTNNMIYDLQSTVGSYPVLMSTAGSQYSADEDSIFNNSISTSTALANIRVKYAKHVFLWDNILQNTSAGPYANYWLEVPHPFANAISSDFNLFDLRGTNVFDSLIEYDVRYGTVLQTRYFRRLNDWRSYVGQDMHSLTGDPRFSADSLHMPSALTYIESPAANNGQWLGTATQAYDFNGNPRLAGNSAVDIGAEEWDGFQYTNDLAVMSIVQPSGFSETSDTSLVTTESPLWITAWVKNLSSQQIFNRTVNAQVQQAINGGPWVTIYNSNSATMTWNTNETKSVVFQGPAIDTATVAQSVFRIVVSVPNDQNNANNSQTKTFRILLKRNAVLVSYNGSTPAGLNNVDSVEMALARMGVPYDLLDRNAPDGLTDSTDIDYTPWWTLVWVSGDPTVALTAGQPTGQGALSFKETQEVERYLHQGQTYAKKNLVIAGQNIAYYNGYTMPNNNVTDTEWLQSYMHTMFRANSPVSSGTYSGWIVGQQPAYWKYPDMLTSTSPDVVKPSFTTPLVGSTVTGYAYTYATHPATPADSGAGTTYYDPLVNTVFYGFDWADPIQTAPGGFGDTTSGTTRTLAAAFAFFRSHGGTILPVEFVNATAEHVGQSNALIGWQIAQQTDVASYEVQEQQPGVSAASAAGTTGQPSWVTLGQVSAQDNQTQYSYTDENIDLAQSYTFRVVAVDKNGARTYSNAVELGPDAQAMGYTLGQNYPNPATAGATQVAFTLPESANVTLRVMDVTGKVMATPVSNASYTAGEQTVTMDLSGLANGSYVYELVATGQDGQTVTLSKKLTLNK